MQGLAVHNQRDLVVKLTWQGEADLDLEATDPTGSACNNLKCQSVGGCTLFSDLNAGQHSELYSVAEGFPGQYKLTVRRVWGRPTGNKATLEIVQNKGTADERIQRETLTLDEEAGFTVNLTQGRRTESASITSPETLRQLALEHRQTKKSTSGLSQLENLATPVALGRDGKVQSIQGMAGIKARSEEAQRQSLIGQTEVNLPQAGGVGVAASIRTSADGRSTILKIDPIFIKKDVVEKTLPIIPGSGL
jgi:hypothetical protein